MSETQKELVQALGELARIFPDWRFGQIVENVAFLAGEEEPRSAWDAEDDDMLRSARCLLEKHRDRIPLYASPIAKAS